MPDLQFRVRPISQAPIPPAHRYSRRLALFAFAFASLAILSQGLGRKGVSASDRTIQSAQTIATASAGVVVAGFSVTDDLSTALVGLINAGDTGFLGPTGSIRADETGLLRVPLDFGSEMSPATVTVSVDGVPDDVLQINYYPAQFYRSQGIKSGGVIDLYTTLPRSNNSARNEDTSPPADVSPAASQAAWDQVRAQADYPAVGALIDDQIRQLYMQFDAVNDPSVGTVCDRGMSGTDMYSAIALRTCYLTCTGHAIVTDAFLASLEIPARYISLGGPYSYLPDGVLVESSQSHDTTEMWVNGQWQWLDPTFRVLRATGPDGSTLTLDSLMQALSDQSTRSELSFTRLDPATDEWQTLTWDNEDVAFRQALSDCLSADKIMLIG